MWRDVEQRIEPVIAALPGLVERGAQLAPRGPRSGSSACRRRARRDAGDGPDARFDGAAGAARAEETTLLVVGAFASPRRAVAGLMIVEAGMAAALAVDEMASLGTLQQLRTLGDPAAVEGLRENAKRLISSTDLLGVDLTEAKLIRRGIQRR